MEKDIASEKFISEYQLLNPLFLTILKEMKELSKKKAGDVINEYKGKTINKILKRLLEILKNEPTIDFLELVDLDMLPTNSDVVFIMVQFETSLNKFSNKYSTGGYSSARIWNKIEEENEEDYDDDDYDDDDVF